jgi:hypothetical protein
MKPVEKPIHMTMPLFAFRQVLEEMGKTDC